jgi:hypothetical protein
VERLNSQYLGQIVQILINLEYFETACRELELLLIQARSSTSAGGPIVLNATEQFRGNKKTAEKRIFELVNSKIDDLVETAEYDWYRIYFFPYEVLKFWLNPSLRTGWLLPSKPSPAAICLRSLNTSPIS